MPPNIFPNQAIAPTFQVPANMPQQTQTQIRPSSSLIGGLISNILNSRERVQPVVNDYNKAWVSFL
jgi:hypothetical protein